MQRMKTKQRSNVNSPEPPVKGDFESNIIEPPKGVWVYGGDNGESNDHPLGPFDLGYVRKKPTLVDDLMGGCITAKDLLVADIPINPPYLGNFLREADQGFLYAWRGTGKTLLAMLMAKGLTQGGEVGPWPSHVNETIVHVDGEMPLGLMESRMRLMGINSDRFILLNHEWLFRQSECVLNLVNVETQQNLGEFCCRKRAKFLILDNLSTLCVGLGADSDNDAWDRINPWLLHLRRYGIAVLILDHEGKARTHRGASRKEDSIAYAIKLIENCLSLLALPVRSLSASLKRTATIQPAPCRSNGPLPMSRTKAKCW